MATNMSRPTRPNKSNKYYIIDRFNQGALHYINLHLKMDIYLKLFSDEIIQVQNSICCLAFLNNVGMIFNTVSFTAI
jgi:hypothetical protein